MKVIRLHDLEFEMFIAPEQINETVGRLALAINHDYQGRNPILLIVLNGAFVFYRFYSRTFFVGIFAEGPTYHHC
jgi:hypoxanthine-guanine phosphoribosyltransferase